MINNLKVGNDSNKPVALGLGESDCSPGEPANQQL